MNVVFITINDLHFLPNAFKSFLSKANPNDSYKVLLVQPTFRKQTVISMVYRYYKTFGVNEFLSFFIETLIKKLLASIRKAKKDRKLYSVKAVFEAYGCEVVSTDKSVNGTYVLDLLEKWKTDIIISVGCPQILKKKL